MSTAGAQPVAGQYTGAAPVGAAVARSAPWGFLEFFVIVQVVAPAILFLPGTQALRVPIRILPFAVSLAGLIFLLRPTRDPRPHPAWMLLLGVAAYLCVQILHPQTNTLLAGLAHAGLYMSVMAPVVWAPYLIRDDRQVMRVLMILLICTGINSAVGVLQVIDPDRFLPREYSTIVEAGYGPIGYVTDEGKQVIRPPGLSDNPGAVCGPATTAALLGLVGLTLRLRWWVKALGVGFAALGVAAIFLSHVRTNILILGGMVIVYIAVLLLQRETKRAATAITSAAVLAFGAFTFAVALGGTAVVDRFRSLIEDDPASVYYASARGYMLQFDTAYYLENNPLGAGLARWGMMRVYFGDESNDRSTPLWAELQWPAWALDGGWVLLILYQLAVLRTAAYEWKTAMRAGADTSLRSIAAIVFAANMGTVALIFGFTPFTNQVGLMYWFLAGLLHGAVLTHRRGIA